MILSVSDLQKTFHMSGKELQAVRGVSFTVPKGKIVALVGESGSGKSTIANLVLGLEKPTNGSIVFKGNTVLNDKKSIQIVFQEPHSSFNPRMTMGEALFEPLFVQNLYKIYEEAFPKLVEAAAMVGLGKETLDRYPHAFSGGQLQRFAIARALLLEPELLVLDEPLASLDLSQQAQILRLLSDVKERLGLTFLFITHDLQVVKAFADEVVVLYLGQVMEQGSTKEIFKNPRHPYTQALLSSIPPDNPWDERTPMKIGSLLPSPFSPPSGCPFRTRCPFALPRCNAPVPCKHEDSHLWWCIL